MQIIKVRGDSVADQVGASIAKAMRAMRLDASRGLEVTAIGQTANHQAAAAIAVATRYLERDRPHMILAAAIHTEVEVVSEREQTVYRYRMGWQPRQAEPPVGVTIAIMGIDTAEAQGAAIAKALRGMRLDASKGIEVTATGAQANYRAAAAIAAATKLLDRDRPHMFLSAAVATSVERVGDGERVVYHYRMGWQPKPKKPPEEAAPHPE